METKFTIDRRQFLKGTGYLALSFTIPAGPAFAQAAQQSVKLPRDLERNNNLGAWIRVNADETVTLFVGKVELGQGILTAVTQICADELDVDIERIRIVSGDTALVPDEGTTAGSNSMPRCAPAVAQASAEVRDILLDLASKSTGQSKAQLTVADGVISGPNGAKATYWALVNGNTFDLEATGRAQPKKSSEHRYVGQSIPRSDIPAKMTGEAIFVQEHRPDGLVFGQVARPPTYKAKLIDVDTAAIEAMPGVIKVVRNGSFLGVVATREEQAIAAAEAMEKAAQWDVEKALPTDATMADWLVGHSGAEDSEIKNDPRTGGPAPAKVLEATYYRPYHMHASLGTSAAIATLQNDGVMLIQTHSQSVFATATAIEKMLGMEEGKVRCQHMQGSGCYGHNMADDAAADSALLANAVPGRPVKLQYTRQHEHRWEPYGSAMVVKTKAGVDGDGNILDWDYELWSTPHSSRPGGNPGNLLSGQYLETPFEPSKPRAGRPPSFAADRNAIALYEYPGHRVTTHFIKDRPLRVSATRGLGAYANVFAIESFMDELALNAGADPVEYRLRVLKDERARDVVIKAAETFGWDSWEKRRNRGRGFSFAQYKNSQTFCAVAMEVEVNRRSGRIRLLRVAAAADAGNLVNPNGVATQIEGGIIQALSWSIKEEVKFDNTRVLSEDWASYPILTFSEVPPVEVVLIDRPDTPVLGTGEASQGPGGAALANAVFDATGVRFRRVPFTPSRIREGLRA